MKIFYSILILSKILYGDFTVIPVAENLDKPVFVQGFPDNTDEIIVIEQAGKLKKINTSTGSEELFLDITDRVHNPVIPGDERGLLGFTFSLDYKKSKSFFVNYVNKNNESVISRFSLDNFKNENIILKFQQPFPNHNGGMLAFGPNDGYLYISVGDGGDSGDPLNHAQNINTIYGTILRIEVLGNKYSIPKTNPFVGNDRAKKEIWAFGLRNPWRFSFDKLNGDLYIADVGQSKWEEVNFQSFKSRGGENYGWNYYEGNHKYKNNKIIENIIMPVFEYSNDMNYMKVLFGWDEEGLDGCSITGGYVYRGKSIPEIYGKYFFSDYCSGNIWSLKIENGIAIDVQNHTRELSLGQNESVYISSFGEDKNGEIYIVDYNGTIFKIIKKI
ncbi:MAG: glucose dehydrogenase [Candidatus Marinimicrobia bacterium]|nr:glucose dehydrogenase [Candidatus Neomarinimicrobiota bacterium]|tara:strand:- start:782 stop:1942 length:1161 start_codon:yes stop_codon:yes gene_type:complete